MADLIYANGSSGQPLGPSQRIRAHPRATDQGPATKAFALCPSLSYQVISSQSISVSGNA